MNLLTKIYLFPNKKSPSKFLDKSLDKLLFQNYPNKKTPYFLLNDKNPINKIAELLHKNKKLKELKIV